MAAASGQDQANSSSVPVTGANQSASGNTSTAGELVAPTENTEQLLAMLRLKGKLRDIGREQHDRETNYIVQDFDEDEDDDEESDDETATSEDDDDYVEEDEDDEEDLQNSGESPHQYRALLKAAIRKEVMLTLPKWQETVVAPERALREN